MKKPGTIVPGFVFLGLSSDEVMSKLLHCYIGSLLHYFIIK